MPGRAGLSVRHRPAALAGYCPAGGRLVKGGWKALSQGAISRPDAGTALRQRSPLATAQCGATQAQAL